MWPRGAFRWYPPSLVIIVWQGRAVVVSRIVNRRRRLSVTSNTVHRCPCVPRRPVVLMVVVMGLVLSD